MNTKNYITITLNGKEFLIDEHKLLFVISKLTDRKITSKDDLFAVMKKFNLYDEYFLENINLI